MENPKETRRKTLQATKTKWKSNGNGMPLLTDQEKREPASAGAKAEKRAAIDCETPFTVPMCERGPALFICKR